MKIGIITLLALSVNYLIDKKVEFTVDELRQHTEDETLFETLATKGDDVRMDGINRLVKSHPVEKAELLDALGRMTNAYVSEDFGVDNKANGLLYLNGMLNEFIQETDAEVKLR